MTSIIDICNAALDHVAGNPITSLDDQVEQARLCKRNFPLARDATLRAFPWPCAIRSDTLAPLANTTVPWGSAYEYQLPTDCLRMLTVQGEDFAAWRIEGRSIVTGAGPALSVRYIFRQEDATAYDPLLVDALALNLAIRLVTRMRESAAALTTLTQLYQRTLREAKRSASQERTATAYGSRGWPAARRY